MTRAAAFRQAELTRALKGARKAGLQPSSCTIGADGSIKLRFGEASNDLENDFDLIIGGKQ